MAYGQRPTKYTHRGTSNAGTNAAYRFMSYPEVKRQTRSAMADATMNATAMWRVVRSACPQVAHGEAWRRRGETHKPSAVLPTVMTSGKGHHARSTQPAPIQRSVTSEKRIDGAEREPRLATHAAKATPARRPPWFGRKPRSETA